MARINIEDSLFKDGRYHDLVIKMGSRHAALGAIVEAFIIAQEFYLNEDTDRLIPLTEWKRRKATDYVIECGLAELRGNFVYVCGAEKQFAWLLQRKQAGSKGGRPKKEKPSDQIKQPKSKPTETDRKAEESGSNPLTLSLSPTLSLTQNNNTHTLVSLWNAHATNLSPVRKSNAGRDRKIKSIWPELSESEWVEVISKINSSDFCRGLNSNGWKATFDWLLQKETYLKVLEGKFDNRASVNQGNPKYQKPTFQRQDDINDEINKLLGGDE